MEYMSKHLSPPCIDDYLKRAAPALMLAKASVGYVHGTEIAHFSGTHLPDQGAMCKEEKDCHIPAPASAPAPVPVPASAFVLVPAHAGEAFAGGVGDWQANSR